MAILVNVELPQRSKGETAKSAVLLNEGQQQRGVAAGRFFLVEFVSDIE